MHEPLNIPLDTMRATRHSRRVAPLYIAIFAGMLIGWCAYRAPWTVSQTTEFRPETTNASVRILRTAETVRALTSHEIGDLTLSGSPWTLQYLLTFSQRELTVHALKDGGTAVTVDTKLPDSIRQQANAFGYEVHEHHGNTLLAPAHTSIEYGGRTVTIGAVIPGHAGELHANGASTSISLNKKGLTFHGAGYRGAKQSSLLPVADAEVLAAINIPANLLAFPQIAANTLSTPSEQLINILLSHGGSFVLTKDKQGIGYFLRMDPQDSTVEEVASIGKDLINHQHLSTRTLTTEDGEDFIELFSDTDAFDIAIQAEEDFTFITIANAHGDTLRIAKTTDLLTLANRDIYLDHVEKVRSTCALRAHSWITRDAIRLLADNVAVNHVGIQKIARNAFAEIAITNSDVHMCW